MLMDCIQYAVAIVRADTHADTQTGTENQPRTPWRETNTVVSPHFGARLALDRKQEKRTRVSSSSTLLQWRDESPPADKYPSSPPVCPSQICNVLIHFFLIWSTSHSPPHIARLETVQTMRPALEEISSPSSKVDTCTKREYPRSLLPRALRKTRLYTLFII